MSFVCDAKSSYVLREVGTLNKAVYTTSYLVLTKEKAVGRVTANKQRCWRQWSKDFAGGSY